MFLWACLHAQRQVTATPVIAPLHRVTEVGIKRRKQKSPQYLAPETLEDGISCPCINICVSTPTAKSLGKTLGPGTCTFLEKKHLNQSTGEMVMTFHY